MIDQPNQNYWSSVSELLVSYAIIIKYKMNKKIIVTIIIVVLIIALYFILSRSGLAIMVK